jgi:hypothetical protein
MTQIEPDPLMNRVVALEPGEVVLAEWRADPAIYWKNHLILAVVLGTLAGLALMAVGNPFPWTGPVAAVLAVGARALYLRSEALGESWRLTGRRLLGPGGRAMPRAAIREARPFLGDVQIVTLSGDKHLMKYLSDPKAVIAAIAGTRR